MLFFIFGILADGPGRSLEGFLRLQVSPTRLLSDFTAMEGTGAAFVNAACVGLVGLLFLRLNKISLSGPTVAALFTMIGFALFGKTLLNCLPIMIGVSIAAVLIGKQPKEYSLIAMFGTALGPIVSYVAFEMGFPPVVALPASLIIGVLTGVLVPPLAITMLHLHQGYNLYNVGLTAGFLGLFAASLPSAGGRDISAIVQWGEVASPWLILIIPVLSSISIFLAFASSGRRSWKEFLAIQKLSGRLPSDFCDLEGPGGALLNAGILGLIYSAYIAIIGAPFNGPVLGGLMTVIGFGLFGKHARNVLPVFIGLFLAALLFGKNLTESWVVLAFLFGTGLAPLAGEFGILVGIMAGFLHLVVVERTGTWHGGMNLYNNGFASGLTATLIVSVIEWYKTNAQR
ncbi:MAG TPA: DUF1576 domain-containing protein [Rectinemataceae bacterium]|nr:DUF1576 domain-containing protein [Rectinemataceae bacterium]